MPKFFCFLFISFFYFSKLLWQKLSWMNLSIRGPTLIRDQPAVGWPLWGSLIRARPPLSAVLGEACPLYVHFVSDPLPCCFTVTTASPIERERGKRSQRSKFSLLIHRNQGGFDMCLNKKCYFVLFELKHGGSGQNWLLFENITR